MHKIDLELITQVLQNNNTDIQKINAIMDDLKMAVRAEEEERANRPPPVKKQFVMLLTDPDGSLAERDLTGWVLQIPEDDSPVVVTERVTRAAYQYNITPKGRRLPVKSLGEACEVVTAKLLREENVWVKTKTPVLAVTAPNAIPMETQDPE